MRPPIEVAAWKKVKFRKLLADVIEGFILRRVRLKQKTADIASS
jgi:hypothetical protein